MTPYYQTGAVTLYLGDSTDLLPSFADGSFDAIVTDPPYVNLKGGYRRRASGGVAARVSESASIGDEWDASLSWALEATRIASLGLVVFCSFAGLVETAQAFPLRRAVLLTWHKRNAPPTGKNVPRFTEEYAWGFAKRPGLRWDGFKQTMLDLPKLAAGCMASKERLLNDDGTAAHPTQKPIRLMEWILSALEPRRILDPFVGTGTTLVAAAKLGISATGIERDERFCEMAAKRLLSAGKQASLFLPAEAPPCP